MTDPIPLNTDELGFRQAPNSVCVLVGIWYSISGGG